MTAAVSAPTLARSSALLYAANIGAALLSVANVLVTARALGPSGRGSIAFLTTIAFLSSQLAILGVQQAAANRAGRTPELSPVVAGASVVLSTLLGLTGAAVVALLIVVAPAVGAGARTSLLTLVLLAVPMLVLLTCLQQLVAAQYLFRWYAVAFLLAPVVNLVGNGTLALAGWLDVTLAVCTWVAGQVLSTALLTVALVRAAGGFARPSASIMGELLSFGWRAHLGRVMMLGNYRLDQWVLGSLAGPVPLGLYSVAVAWSEAMFLLPSAVSAAQRPDLVRHDAAQARCEAARAFRVTLIACLPTMAILLLAAPLLCVGLFGEEFRGSVLPLQVLVLGAPGIVALKLLGSALVAQRMPLRETSAASAALAVTVVLDLLLIPAYGATGAAVASASAYTLGGVVAVVLFCRSLPGTGAGLVPTRQDGRDAVALAHVVARRLRRDLPS